MKEEKTENAPVGLMASLLEKEEYQPKSITKGQVIEGTIVAITPKEMLLDVGAKAEGIISIRELDQDPSTYKVGDKLISYVLEPEGEGGQVILSTKRAGSMRVWQNLGQALRNKEDLKVKPVEVNRGGLVVTYDSLKGFIPSSHLRIPLEEALAKSELIVKVIEFDKAFNKLVFSEKETQRVPQRKTQDVDKLKEGEIYLGSITKVAPFGVFVSTSEGVEGLVHISEIAREKIADPGEIYKVGDEVKVKVLGIDHELNRVNLSIKQASSDPWETAHERYTPGNKLEGTVTKVISAGAVIRLEPGVEGIVNFAEGEDKPALEVGQKVSVVVESLSIETQRVTLKIA